jgi:septal ring factor EnvC (AmiA/AmiB activator)
MPFGRLAAALALSVAVAGQVAAAPVHTPDPAASQKLLRQLVDAQKWQSEQIWHVKEQTEALPGLIAEAKEGHADTQAEVGKARDEVKGLYVEISTVKQQIESLKSDIDSVNTNVSRFRTFAGFFLALMILMVFLIFAMTVRR